MSLAKITRKLGLTDRKQPAAGLPRKGFFDRVGPRVVTPAVGPGLARVNHLRAQIASIEPNARKSPAVTVVAPDRHLHSSVQRKLLQLRA